MLFVDFRLIRQPNRMASVSHIEDAIFNIFKNADNKVPVGDFLKVNFLFSYNF